MQQKTEVAFLLHLNLLNFNEVNWNLTGLTTGSDWPIIVVNGFVILVRAPDSS